ncbi:hypothetical protein K0M31_013891, partial [Melipona bicolor]
VMNCSCHFEIESIERLAQEQGISMQTKGLGCKWSFCFQAATLNHPATSPFATRIRLAPAL